MLKFKKAQSLPWTKLLTIVIGIIVVFLIIVGLNNFGILTKLAIIFPFFGEVNDSAINSDSSVNPGSPAEQVLDSSTLKSQINMTSRLKEYLIHAINLGFILHIELNAADRAHPAIYAVKITNSFSLFEKWNYTSEIWDKQDQEPRLSQKVLIKNLEELNYVFGIVSPPSTK